MADGNMSVFRKFRKPGVEGGMRKPPVPGSGVPRHLLGPLAIEERDRMKDRGIFNPTSNVQQPNPYQSTMNRGTASFNQTGFHNQPSPQIPTAEELMGKYNIPGMANGGRIPPVGGTAVVGENGPELITSDRRGTTVLPLPKVKKPKSKPKPKARPKTKRMDTHQQDLGFVTVTSPGGNLIPTTEQVFGRSTSAAGSMGITQDENQRLVDTYGQEYINALMTDPQRAQEMVDLERKRQEQGLAGIQQSLAGLGGARQRTQQAGQRAQDTISRTRGEGLEGIERQRQENLGIPGRIKESGREAVGELERITEGTAQQISVDSQAATERATAYVEDLANRGLEDIISRGDAEVSAYKDMTAEAINTQRGALDAQFEAAKLPLIEKYGSWAKVPANEKMQVSIQQSGAMQTMGQGITTHYNDKMADIQSQVNNRVADASLQITNTLAQVKSNLEQAGLTSVSQARLAGQAQAAGLITQTEQGISFAEQQVGQLNTQLTNAANSFLQTTAQMSIGAEEATQNRLLTIDQLEINGNLNMANYLRAMDETYVAFAPYYAAALQYASDKQMRDELIA